MTMGANSIFGTLRNSSAELANEVACSAVFGTVTTVEPLVIEIEKISGGGTVFGDMLIVSFLCKRQEFDNFKPTEERGKTGIGDPSFESHDHDFHVGLWRGLIPGDAVIMIQFSDKQKYLVLERVEMVVGEMGE